VKRDLIAVRNQILDAKEGVDLERLVEIAAARDAAAELCNDQRLYTAAFAVGVDNIFRGIEEYRRMLSRMRSTGARYAVRREIKRLEAQS
jgi:hypothetical protein